MRFKRVYIEITNTCNLTCDFCIQNHRLPQRMSVEQFQHIVQQILPYTRFIYLHVLGEPLSHSDLDAILQVIDDAGLQVNITTNGTLLKKNKDILLKHTIRQINVSLHSFPQHEHPNYFQDVFKTCEVLAQNGVYINYRLWSLQENVLSEDTRRILHHVLKQYKVEMDEKEIHRLQRIALCPQIALHFEEIFSWPSFMHPYVNEIGRCLGMKDMCAILVDGSVVPCCLDSKGECTLGNVYHEAFSDIITSKKAENIVKGFANHQVVEKLCQHCSYRLRFYK